MFKTKTFLTFIFVFFIAGCGIKGFFSKQDDKIGSIVEFSQIAKLSVDEINKLYGSPKESRASQTIIKTYSIIEGQVQMMLFYENDKLSKIQLDLKNERETSEDALKAAGIAFQDNKPDWENEIVKSYKNRTVNGVEFKEIEVDATPRTNKWKRVRAALK